MGLRHARASRSRPWPWWPRSESCWSAGSNWGSSSPAAPRSRSSTPRRPTSARSARRSPPPGLTGQVVTTIGDPAENEVYIRLGGARVESAGDDPTERVADDLARRGAGPGGSTSTSRTRRRWPAARAGLRAPCPRSRPRALAEVDLAARRERAIFRSVDELATVEGVPQTAVDALRRARHGRTVRAPQPVVHRPGGRPASCVRKARLGDRSARSPACSLYIGCRFQFQWGLAAVVAVVHDTLVTLGLFSLFRKEMSLPVVAAFLTLVGYSVNDTVVIFDRDPREPAAKSRRATCPSVDQRVDQPDAQPDGDHLGPDLGRLPGAVPVRRARRSTPFSFVLVVGIVVGSVLDDLHRQPRSSCCGSAARPPEQDRSRSGAAQPQPERRAREGARQVRLDAPSADPAAPAAARCV